MIEQKELNKAYCLSFAVCEHVRLGGIRQGFIQTPRGVITYNPPVFMRHPQPSEVQRGLSGGVYGGCLCDRDRMGNKRGQILT